MKNLSGLYQSGDWKGEKHVPVIHAPEVAKKGEQIQVRVVVGEEIAHPNTFEHYISWIKVYFQPEGGKFPIEIGNFDFAAHGESGLFTEPNASLSFIGEKSGTIYATSYCNIHGLWENSKEIKIEE